MPTRLQLYTYLSTMDHSPILEGNRGWCGESYKKRFTTSAGKRCAPLGVNMNNRVGLQDKTGRPTSYATKHVSCFWTMWYKCEDSILSLILFVTRHIKCRMICRIKNLWYKTLVQKKLVKSALRFLICEIAEVVQMIEIDLLSISANTICRSWTIMLSV